MVEFDTSEERDDMNTFIVNPGKGKGKSHGKSHKKGSSGKHHRSNPGNPRHRGKSRGSSRRGFRRNPGIGAFLPGAGGGLAFRAGLKLITGDEGIRGTDGKLTTKTLLGGAALLYFSDKIANTIGIHGQDEAYFSGGMSGVAGSMAIDQFAPDLSAKYLVPMGAGGTHGLAGMSGSTPNAPMSLAAYNALAGIAGALPAIGAVVYVQGADGRVYEVPTTGVAGPTESVTLPAGAQPGHIIRRKSDGARFRVKRDGNGIFVERIGGMSGPGASTYLRAS